MAKTQKMLRVKLVRSLNRRTDKHAATVKGLGLRRLHHVVEVQDTPEIRGMINSISYLLLVEEV